MIELNDETREFPIMVEDKESFTIGDTSKFGDYIKGGIVYQIKKPKIIKYEDYKTGYKRRNYRSYYGC